MKRLSFLPFAAFALLLTSCADDAIEPTLMKRQLSMNQSTRYLVEFNGNGAPRGFADKVAQLGGVVQTTHPAGLGLVSGLSDEGALALRSVPGVGAVLEDVTVTIPPAQIAAAALDAEAIIQSQANPTTAARYSFQWNMRQIGADVAWAAGKLGDPSVSVSILDTGLDYGNRDFNGLVDLARSVSFVDVSTSGYTAIDPDTLRHYFGPGWHPITDLHGHGTNVGSQVSSLAFATAGVSSKTRLIGVKVFDQNASGSLSNILLGVLHSVDVDADVINMSLGVPKGTPKAGLGRYVSLVNRIFNYAHRKGSVVVVAAGNDATDMDHDGNLFQSFCNAPNVICVSATGPTGFTGNPQTGPRINPDAFAFYSNFGRSAVDVAAPGGNIGGAVWSFCARHAPHPFFQSKENPGPRFPCTSGGALIGMAGTSQAAPHVAGLAALLVFELGKNNPSAIKEAIQLSADDLGQEGTDPHYGKGRINVARALGL